MRLVVAVVVLVALQVTWAHPLLQLSLRQSAKSVICPHDQGECPDGDTCCQLSSGLYGCCPLPNAVCCSDHLHCCPNGDTCDVAAGTCTKQAERPRIRPMAEKRPSIMKVKDVQCDFSQSCPSGDTCCLLPDGFYGCCPLSHAVCCYYSEYCCPSGYACDPFTDKCTKQADQIKMVENAIMRVKNVICPDGQSECPDGNTCCQLSSGQWGCCPLPNAVCCSDHLHCCPNGDTCDVAAGTCTKQDRIALATLLKKRKTL